MFPYPNKYIEVSDKTPIKDIGYAFLDSGFTLKLYHRIINGICDCWEGAICRSPGKHPLFGGKGMTGSRASFDNALIKYPNLSMGIITGYYPEMEKQLVVIDFDTKLPEVWNKVVAKLPSLLLPTYTVETNKGKHYWFWAPKGSHIGTSTGGALADKVDILSSNDRGVLAIGSLDKVLLDNSPIATLSAEDCKYLHEISPSVGGHKPKVSKKPKVSGQKKVGTKFSPAIIENSSLYIDNFNNGKTKEGQYYHTLVFVFGSELRRNWFKYKNNQVAFIDWAKEQLANNLPLANVKQAMGYANNLYKTFDPNKVISQMKLFENLSGRYSAETKGALLDIFQYGFSINPPNGSIINQGQEWDDNCGTVEYSSSIKALWKTVYAHLIALDIHETVYFTEKQFVIFLSHFHPGIEKQRQSIYVDGKRQQPWLWNLSPVSHIQMLSDYSIAQNKNQGQREDDNCGTPNKYVSIFTQDNTITIPTVEQEPKTMNKTQLMSKHLMSIYNNNKKSIQQERITSTAVPPVEYVQEAKVEDVKVFVPEKQSTVEAPAALSAYNKTMALLESLRIPPPAYTDKVERAFAEAGFF